MSIDVFPATVLNSTLWNGQTYEEGTFTVTGTGFSGGDPSGTAYYVRVGKQVTLTLPTLSGTSNTDTFVVVGIPASLSAGPGAAYAVPVTNAGVHALGLVNVPVGGTMNIQRDIVGTAWTASAQKTLWNTAITYRQ